MCLRINHGLSWIPICMSEKLVWKLIPYVWFPLLIKSELSRWYTCFFAQIQRMSKRFLPRRWKKAHIKINPKCYCMTRKKLKPVKWWSMVASLVLINTFMFNHTHVARLLQSIAPITKRGLKGLQQKKERKLWDRIYCYTANYQLLKPWQCSSACRRGK